MHLTNMYRNTAGVHFVGSIVAQDKLSKARAHVREASGSLAKRIGVGRNSGARMWLVDVASVDSCKGSMQEAWKVLEEMEVDTGKAQQSKGGEAVVSDQGEEESDVEGFIESSLDELRRGR